MATSLRDELGNSYDFHSPKMPNEDSPEYEVWKDRIKKDLAAMDGEVILVGHSLGASVLLKFLSEEEVENPGGAEGFEHGEVGTAAAPTASGSLVASFPVGHSQPTSRQG
jgi:hypothetical protein